MAVVSSATYSIRGMHADDLGATVNSGMRSNLRAAMYPWLASRAAIGFGLAIVHIFREPFTRIGSRNNIVGLFGWDASFYREIAQHGYRAVEQTDGLRFFPLYPLVARLLGGSDVALLAVSNLAALGALALLHHVTLLWTSSPQAAGRAVWIMALGPGVAASMMGYAEPLFLVLAIGCCVALHEQMLALAALLGQARVWAAPVPAGSLARSAHCWWSCLSATPCNDVGHLHCSPRSAQWLVCSHTWRGPATAREIGSHHFACKVTPISVVTTWTLCGPCGRRFERLWSSFVLVLDCIWCGLQSRSCCAWSPGANCPLRARRSRRSQWRLR